ncbi:MAG: response regulator [Planctomycetota bacterium]|nr:MAG: response regulator [Planctomycetota bacterium]
MFGLFNSKKKSTRAKILVVDDEPDFVSSVQCRLEWCGYEVINAANGEEALEKVRNEKPDLVLLDTSMPVMNGHEVLDRLAKNPDLRDIPVIMVTALCEPQDITKASSYGIVDYVAKPFDFTELLRKIADTLGNKKISSNVQR